MNANQTLYYSLPRRVSTVRRLVGFLDPTGFRKASNEEILSDINNPRTFTPTWTNQQTCYPSNYDGELDDYKPHDPWANITEAEMAEYAGVSDADVAAYTNDEIMAMRSKPQFLIDDDDEYQDQLELMWAKDEIRNC